jgi:hypothetical protein
MSPTAASVTVPEAGAADPSVLLLRWPGAVEAGADDRAVEDVGGEVVEPEHPLTAVRHAAPARARAGRALRGTRWNAFMC